MLGFSLLFDGTLVARRDASGVFLVCNMSRSAVIVCVHIQDVAGFKGPPPMGLECRPLEELEGLQDLAWSSRRDFDKSCH